MNNCPDCMHKRLYAYGSESLHYNTYFKCFFTALPLNYLNFSLPDKLNDTAGRRVRFFKIWNTPFWNQKLFNFHLSQYDINNIFFYVILIRNMCVLVAFTNRNFWTTKCLLGTVLLTKFHMSVSSNLYSAAILIFLK